MSEPVAQQRVSIASIAATVEWTDSDALLAARNHPVPGAGRLGELAEWLAATQGRWPPRAPERVRLIVIGAPGDPVVSIAESLGVSVTPLERPEDVDTAFAAGATAADAAADAGVDLVVLADADDGPASGAVIGVLTGTEPVALLPRGRDAVDTAAWIARAQFLRDTRRRVAALRGHPDDLLAALGNTALAASAGVAIGAAARRTPVLLDGTSAVTAALLSYDAQTRAGRWWLVADASPDPVHRRAIEELDQRPVLNLGTGSGDGIAGVLCIPVLRAAATAAQR